MCNQDNANTPQVRKNAPLSNGQVSPAQPMTAWDRAMDEIFFGGRAAKAAAKAAEAADAPVDEAPVTEAPVQQAPAEEETVVPAQPMTAWDRAVDEIFFGGRAAKAAAKAAEVAEAPVQQAPVEEETVVPAQPMTAWDRAVDEIFFGGRAAKAAAKAAEAAEAPVDEAEPIAQAEIATEQNEEVDAQPAFDADAAEEKMMALQHQLQELKIPLVIVLEGWQAAGKGTIAGELLEGLDPRGYNVCVPERFSKDEELYPLMHRYWIHMPRQGMVTVFIGSWYHDLCAAMVKGKHPKRTAKRLEQIQLMEQMLVQDGAIIEKFFLDIPQKVQKKRLKELESKKATRGSVTKADWDQNRRYDRWQQAYRQVMDETAQTGATWHLLDGQDKKACKRALYETILNAMENAIAQRKAGDRSWDTETLHDHEPIPTEPIPQLELFETDLTLDREYKDTVNAAQKKLHKLQYELFRKGIPMVIAFEGWDAAGKGGSIRRLTSALDPRGFTVVPIASPTAEEKQHHHMWRFWKALPQKGDIRIFDRTWYGRAMVERLEGFCTEAQWKRSYEEMNLFEQDLAEDGAIICKFWLQISQDEQLKRFLSRQNNPAKQWKLSDEDWRNRDKWDLYEEAINDMLQKTNTAYAPWTVVEADNKHFARVKVLETVISAIEKRLAEE